MSDGLFWLSEERFARITPHLPSDTRGKARVDDHRVISGIIHVIKSGGRWVVAGESSPKRYQVFRPSDPH